MPAEFRSATTFPHRAHPTITEGLNKVSLGRVMTMVLNSLLDNERVSTLLTIHSKCWQSTERSGRHEETRTPDLYRVKVALSPTELRAYGTESRSYVAVPPL